MWQWQRQLLVFILATGAFCFNTVIIFLLMIVKMQRYMFEILFKELKKLLQASNPNIHKISKICDLHNQLYGSIRMFNNAFGLCYIAMFFYNVGMHTCQLYIGPYSATIQKLPNILIFNACLNAFWVLPSWLFCSMLGHQCQRTKHEAERIRLLLQYDVDFNKKKLNDLVHDNL